MWTNEIIDIVRTIICTYIELTKPVSQKRSLQNVLKFFPRDYVHTDARYLTILYSTILYSTILYCTLVASELIFFCFWTFSCSCQSHACPHRSETLSLHTVSYDLHSVRKTRSSHEKQASRHQAALLSCMWHVLLFEMLFESTHQNTHWRETVCLWVCSVYIFIKQKISIFIVHSVMSQYNLFCLS